MVKRLHKIGQKALQNHRFDCAEIDRNEVRSFFRGHADQRNLGCSTDDPKGTVWHVDSDIGSGAIMPHDVFICGDRFKSLYPTNPTFRGFGLLIKGYLTGASELLCPDWKKIYLLHPEVFSYEVRSDHWKMGWKRGVHNCFIFIILPPEFWDFLGDTFCEKFVKNPCFLSEQQIRPVSSSWNGTNLCGAFHMWWYPCWSDIVRKNYRWRREYWVWGYCWEPPSYNFWTCAWRSASGSRPQPAAQPR